MKRKTKAKIILIIMVLLILLSISQISNAAVLQSNPTTNSTPTKKAGNSWGSAIRNMETSGQAMGLSATINSTSLLDSSTPNNIDVHMMKSTEYGAVAILSASGFGNPANTTTIDTTTGNKTGVYMQTGIAESVSAGGSKASGMSGTSRAHRYFNTYTTSTTSAKPGDAITLNWHSPGARKWISDGYSGLFRGGSYGVFGFTVIYVPDSSHASRAVIVCGQGF